MPKILIVDDDAEVRQYLHTVLSADGHRVDGVGSGDEALNVLMGPGANLVITDVMMPGMDGYSLVRRMREFPAVMSVPVIFHTAISQQDEAKVLAAQCGAFSLLIKPSTPAEIRHCVDRALNIKTPAVRVNDGFDRAHLELLNNELSARVRDLEAEIIERRRLQEQVRAWAGRLEAVREEERARIALGIHDELGQALTSLKMDMHWLKASLPEPSAETSARMADSLDLIDGAIAAMRRIITELRPSILDHLGLAAAVEWQARDFMSRSGLDCTIDVPETMELEPERATALFRILQEALTNIAKHADARHIRIELKEEKGRACLEVEDDGRGFKVGAVRPDAFGLVGMRERAALVNGELAVVSVPGMGCLIQASIPMALQQAQDSMKQELVS